MRDVDLAYGDKSVWVVSSGSRTAPGEVIWAFPASDVPWGER